VDFVGAIQISEFQPEGVRQIPLADESDSLNVKERCKILIMEALQATDVIRGAMLQPLWSGYGEIYRVHLTGSEVSSAIVKHVTPHLQDGNHPRGWHNSQAVQRKLKSYQIEQTWYERHAAKCTTHCRVPTCYASDQIGPERWIVLEDLDSAGYSQRASQLSAEQCRPCLHWLAHFHAQFLNACPTDLWPVGTYWHLATRSEEWSACSDPELKKNAGALDTMLNQCRYQTLVHGDAKVANFCFSEEPSILGVAAVDFQYTGKGCGIRDVAYFLGSCLDDRDCQMYAEELIDDYFLMLESACRQKPGVFSCGAFKEIEDEWRHLYPVACADFHRFLAGWAPDHKKINDHTREQTRIALNKVSQPGKI